MAAATKAVEAADVVEDVKELLEDTVELVEGQTSWLKTTNAKLILVGVSALALGAGVSYLISAKRLEKKYQKLADEQVASVKARYSVIHKSGESLTELADKYPDEEKAEDSKTAKAIIVENQYISYDRVETVTEAPEASVDSAVSAAVVVEESSRDAELVHHNIFESDNPDTYFDFAEELERRATKPDSPHVITKDEFDENESEYDQNRLVYFDGDDVLADSNDQPITDVDNVVGYENLLRFGHGSGDPNIVYVRCPKLELDFELIHSDGKFAKEVLGFDDGETLQHSQRRPPRRFRPTDE
jgi:hypothetical protein